MSVIFPSSYTRTKFWSRNIWRSINWTEICCCEDGVC